MLDKIKKFVKSVSPLTWTLVILGVFTVVVLWAASNHSKAVEVKPAAVETPAAK